MEGRIRAIAVAVMACALLSLTAGRVEAQYPTPLGVGIQLTLDIKGSATLSNGGDGGYPVQKFSARTVSLGTSDILNMISSSSGIIYPAGAKLVLDPSSDILVEDQSGNLVENLAADGYINVLFSNGVQGAGAGVWSGQANSATGAQKFSGSYFTAVTINDQLGDTIEVSGLTKERYSLTSYDSNELHESDSVTMTLVGEGNISGSEAIYSFTVTGRGKVSLHLGGRGSPFPRYPFPPASHR